MRKVPDPVARILAENSYLPRSGPGLGLQRRTACLVQANRAAAYDLYRHRSAARAADPEVR